MVAIINGARVLLSLLFSKKEQWVESREELNQAWQHDYVEPFNQGLNTAPVPKQKRFGRVFNIVLILALILIWPLLFWLRSLG